MTEAIHCMCSIHNLTHTHTQPLRASPLARLDRVLVSKMCDLQGVEVRQILESRGTHKGQRVVIEMSAMRDKHFFQQEWAHLLDNVCKH